MYTHTTRQNTPVNNAKQCPAPEITRPLFACSANFSYAERALLSLAEPALGVAAMLSLRSGLQRIRCHANPDSLAHASLNRIG